MTHFADQEYQDPTNPRYTVRDGWVLVLAQKDTGRETPSYPEQVRSLEARIVQFDAKLTAMIAHRMLYGDQRAIQLLVHIQNMLRDTFSW